MMSKGCQPESQRDRAEEKDENNSEDAPMKRFKSLTRRLLNVSNVQLKEELARDAKKKGKTR